MCHNACVCVCVCACLSVHLYTNVFTEMGMYLQTDKMDVHLCVCDLHGVFTLPNTEANTETKTDTITTVPNGNL